MNSAQTVATRRNRWRRTGATRQAATIARREGPPAAALKRSAMDWMVIWLFAGLGLALIGIQLSLLHRISSTAQFGLSLMVWPALIYMVRRRWATVPLESGVAGVLCGGCVLALVLVNSLWMDPSNHVYPYLHPIFAGLGLGLLAVGFRGLHRYWQELTILALLGIPRLLLTAWEGLAYTTAKVATFLIYYLGREVQLVGTEIIMPGGAVVVDQGCAGPGVISYLLCLGVLFVFLFPLRPARRVVVILVAPTIAVLTNLLRVVLLALLEDAGRHDAFDYWHNGSGSPVWTMLPILLFFFTAMSLVDRPRKQGDPNPPEGGPEEAATSDEGALDDDDSLATDSRP